MEFDVLAFGFAPQDTNQGERLTIDGKLSAIPLELPHFLERLAVEQRLARAIGPSRAQQS